MADIKKFAEELAKHTSEDYRDIVFRLKEEYGIAVHQGMVLGNSYPESRRERRKREREQLKNKKRK